MECCGHEECAATWERRAFSALGVAGMGASALDACTALLSRLLKGERLEKGDADVVEAAIRCRDFRCAFEGLSREAGVKVEVMRVERVEDAPPTHAQRPASA